MITLKSGRFTLLQAVAALNPVISRRSPTTDEIERAGFKQPRLSKLRHGDLVLTVEAAEGIAELYGATDQERVKLCDLAQQCQTVVTQKRVHLQRGTSPLLNILRRLGTPNRLTAVGATVIPEALQTAQYMLAANGMTSCSPPLVSLAHTEAASNHEMLRNLRESLLFLVSEAAVRTVVGDHATMSAALRHMIKLISASSVAIQVVPLDAVQQPLAAPVNFELSPDSVLVPTPTGFLHLDGPNDLAVYSEIARQLRECALSPEASLARLADIADGHARAAHRST